MADAKTVFIAGPTAGGKSAAALALARRIGGEIVNADAMQVYRDLRILTARPSDADEAAAPHHLYGALDGAEACSAGRWARMAAVIINEIAARGRTAIVTGGTGLYFKALEEGLSPIPETPPAVRAEAQARREELGPAAFRAEALARDTAMAHLPEGDAQRLLRVWEVFEATGKPLSYCGEQAADLVFAAALIAVGMRRFSIPPTAVGGFRRLVRSVKAAELADWLKPRIAVGEGALPMGVLRRELSLWLRARGAYIG